MPDETTAVADAAAAALKEDNADGVAAKLAADQAAEKAAADKAANGEDKDATAKAAADKVVADKAAAEAAKGDLSEKLAGAPETYEAFTAEDGAEIDKGLLERLTPLAKELGLTQDKAQALVNSETARLKDEVAAEDQAWKDMQTEWRDASKADKEIGGTKYDETVGNAVAFIKAFGNEAFVEAMKVTGVINHPEFLRTFSKAGAAIGEDKMHIGDAPKASERSQAQRIFPNHGT